MRLASKAPVRRLAFRRPFKPRLSKYLRAYVGKRIEAAAEPKHVYSTLNTTTASAATYLQLTTIPQGTTDITRIGDQIKLKRLQMTFNLGAGDPTNIIRILIFQWNLTTTPTDAEVFEDTSSVVGQLAGTVCRDSIHGRKLTVLRDLKVALNNVNYPNKYFSVNVPLRRCRKVAYVGGSSTVAVGNIYMMYMSDSSVVVHPVIQAGWTIDFVDM